ncbi:probable E3 ubiquitin-protein ligase RNF144A-A isoform X2 [Protopterus annectens]|uniref:probable E3 ubiquitin-protein ligase RNF144A-A isoform X2 n=1 Tax=Protopterus annectens TaxID=7888 RepID=UPI001CFAEE5F|nr:probable E3 ubiquitin-protein ligase RNF144A-A isoform X2 [Protopterus annectens]
MDLDEKQLADSLQVMCSSEISEPHRSGILRVKASCHHLVNSSCLQEWVKMLIDKCPRCFQLLQLYDHNTLCVACRVCSENDKKVYQFCWACKKEWNGPSLNDECCAHELCPLQATLLSCPVIIAPDLEVNECPSVRACPRCEALVTHSLDGCPEVKCPNCLLNFCYRCLEKHGMHRYIEEEECLVLDEIEDRDNSFCMLSERQTLTGKVWNPEENSSSECTTESEEDDS